jgi:hypothetical protein
MFKKFKKILSIVTLTTLLFSTSIIASAKETSSPLAGPGVRPCDLYGQHHMKSSALGEVMYLNAKGGIIDNYVGARYKCDCGHVLIFEGDGHPEDWGLSGYNGRRFATCTEYGNYAFTSISVSQNIFYNQKINSSDIVWTGYLWYR